MNIRAVIADDEPYARERLRELCALEPDVAVVGEAAHGAEAIRQIEATKPDLLLLDIQMRGTDGFGVLRSLATGQRPLVVFVTAHDQYAVDAFDVDAVDYLLKPFDRERFSRAIGRVRERLAGGLTKSLSQRVSSAVRESTAAARRLVVERDGRLFFIPQDKIDYIEAKRNYVDIRTRERTFTIRWTMQQAEAALDPGTFLRVHRSVIINTRKIREMQRWFCGEYIITLTSGYRVTSGRAYRDRIREHLERTR